MLIRVLVFPGGTEVGLEIFHSLRYCKEIKLFSAASPVKHHAPYMFQNHYELPNIQDEGCIETLIKLIVDLKIDCIFPSNSLVIDFLNSCRHLLPCALVLATPEALRLTRSKTLTYKALAGLIPTPIVYDSFNDTTPFPLFLKPDAMYGSQNTRFISSLDVLRTSPPSMDDIVCEYLPGQEYTIDCFSTLDNRLLFAGPRTRERIRMGTSMHSERVPNNLSDLFVSYAEIIQNTFGLTGAWFFQIKADAEGVFKILEVEARVAGTMAFHRVQGVNFPLLSIFDLFGIKVNVKPIDVLVDIDRALVNRYKHNIDYECVYVDLDDTIIIKGRLNLQLIKYLYQCVNNGIRIILVSKSLDKSPDEYLKKWKISQIFDEVHWLKESESKADYIKSEKSIFIDDSFLQRMEVSRKCGILTFDSSMVELLIDDRGE